MLLTFHNSGTNLGGTLSHKRPSLCFYPITLAIRNVEGEYLELFQERTGSHFPVASLECHLVSSYYQK